MLKNNSKYTILFICFTILSCQPIELIDDIVFDYNQFSKITISAEQKKIINLYDSKFSEPYIDHSLENTPIQFLNKWFDNNINIIGTENLLEMIVLDASIKKSEIPNNDSKKYQEKTIFIFEISYLVEFTLYDDHKLILANSIVESKRSTTSGKYISLMETERIIDTLILDCLIDISKKSEELIKIHMSNYIL